MTPIQHRNIYKLLSEENTGIPRPDIRFGMEGNILTIVAADGPWVKIETDRRTALFNLTGLKTLAPDDIAQGDVTVEADGSRTCVLQFKNRTVPSIIGLATNILTSKWVETLFAVLRSVQNDDQLLRYKINAGAFRIKKGAVARALTEHRGDLVAAVDSWRIELFDKMFSAFGEPPSDSIWDTAEASAHVRRDLLKHAWLRRLYAVFNGQTGIQEVLTLIARNRTLRRSLYNMPGGLNREVLRAIIRMVQKGLDLRSPLPADRVFWLAVSSVMGSRKVFNTFETPETVAALQKRYDILCRTPVKTLRRQLRRYVQQVHLHNALMRSKVLRNSQFIRGYFLDVFDLEDEWVDRLGRGTTFARLEEASNDWHRMARLETLKAYFPEDRPAVIPPIPLPDAPGLRFLEKAGDFYEEHNLMRHCIDTYVQKGLEGQGYYFHYTAHNGDVATIEVGPYPDGRWAVIQARGPFNAVNAATQKATQLLNAWAAQIPTADPALRRSFEIEEFPV